jgi:DNA-binding PadR family transcriptional regulator
MPTTEVQVPQRRDPGGFLPLKPEDFQILLALEGGERHGYALMKEIERATEGAMAPAASPFYRKLKRMEEEGLLAETDARPAPSLDDERRRYYALTPLGREVLALEARRVVALAGHERIVRLARSAEAGG